jgi:hypothetical protein
LLAVGSLKGWAASKRRGFHWFRLEDSRHFLPPNNLDEGRLRPAIIESNPSCPANTCDWNGIVVMTTPFLLVS